jgi:hypothetical protein
VRDLLPGSTTSALTAEDSGAGHVENSIITPKIQGMAAIGMSGPSFLERFCCELFMLAPAFRVEVRLLSNAQ